MQAIPTLYVPQIQPDDVVKTFDDLLTAISVTADYAQIDPGAPPLAGAAIKQALINPGDPGFVNFFNQAGYQHVDAYFELLGVAEVTPLMAPLKASAAAAGPTDVLGRLQIKLDKFRAAGAGH